jgi:plasmid stabilization system protein ParE
MSYAVLKSLQAVRDIEEAFVYIAENDLDKAVYFLVAIEETIETIAQNPFIRKCSAVSEYQTEQSADVAREEIRKLSDFLYGRRKNYQNNSLS